MGAWRIVIFLSVVTVVWGGGHAYLGWRLVNASSLASPWTLRAWLAVVCLGLLGLVSPFLQRSLPRFAGQGPLLGLTYAALGLSASLVLLTFARDLGWVVFRGLGGMIGVARAQGTPVLWSSPWVQRVYDISNVAIVALSLGISVWGWFTATGAPRIVRHELKVPGLAQGLDGLRIVQLSDMHITPVIHRRYVRRVVELTQSLEPDLVAITGDLADGKAADLSEDAEPLGALSPPLGVWFVTGNHEYFSDPAGWSAAVSRLGMRVLTNESELLERGGARLLVGGVPDPTAGRIDGLEGPDPARVLRQAEDADFRLLLAHQPTRSLGESIQGWDLVLTGHTHGGQYLGFRPIVALVQPYLEGLFEIGSARLFVHRGTGFWGPPNRAGVPPEIVLFTLRRAPL